MDIEEAQAILKDTWEDVRTLSKHVTQERLKTRIRLLLTVPENDEEDIRFTTWPSLKRSY